MKRTADLVIGTVATVVATPVLFLAGLAIVLEDGRPVFFRQARLGRNGRVFRIWKLRTMGVNAPDLRQPDGSTWSGSDDPRVTTIGRVLRRWSVDELPQLFNVILGDMSLVGPRPDQADQLRFYREEDMAKLTMRPGLTGLAQVRGRNAISWRERRRWDRWYVRHWRVGLDCWILMLTVRVILQGGGVASERID